MFPEFTFHHIGILTSSLGESAGRYVSTFGYTECSARIDIAASGIRVCCLEHGKSPRVELIQPTGPDSPLAKRSTLGGYHLAWSVDNIEQAVSQLEADGCHSMNIFTSALWEGARCVFLVNPQQELVELIEIPHS